MNRRLVVRGRYEDRLVRRDADTQHPRRVQVCEEDQDVVLVLVSLEVVEERRAPRALLPEPRQLVVARMLRRKNPLGVAIEGVDIPLLRAREAPHGNAADSIRPLGILVLPRDVVLRAGRQDFHLVLRGEALGNQPAMVFGSAADLGAVALDDKTNSHVYPRGFAPRTPQHARSRGPLRSPLHSRGFTRWRSFTPAFPVLAEASARCERARNPAGAGAGLPARARARHDRIRRSPAARRPPRGPSAQTGFPPRRAFPPQRRPNTRQWGRRPPWLQRAPHRSLRARSAARTLPPIGSTPRDPRPHPSPSHRPRPPPLLTPA